MLDAIRSQKLIDVVLGAILETASNGCSPCLSGAPEVVLAQESGRLTLDNLPAKVREEVEAMISPLNSDLTRNEPKAALWRGEWETMYPSQSEADLALCGHLRRLGLSSAEIDQAFRASGLYRDKWERVDYRTKVLDLVTQPTNSENFSTAGHLSTVEAGTGKTTSIADPDWDLKNGREFAAQYRDRLLFVPETDDWLRFDPATGWSKCGPVEPDQAAKAVVDRLRGQAAQMYLVQPEAGATKRMMNHVSYSSRARNLQAMLSMTKSEPGMYASINEFDADPMQLGVANGVIDLRSGQPVALTPFVRVSKRCNVMYSPGAACPQFLQYLEQVQPSQEIRNFLQRFFGYCLTGHVGEKKFLLLLGTGDNGKTIMVELMSWVLGTYATKIETEMLMEHKRSPQGASPDIVALKGMRFVYANETGEGQRLADARVKDMTGGDSLTGRMPYASAAVTFAPSHKLVIVGNHQPSIHDNSSGMWGRVGLVPFDAVIPAANRDRLLLQKLKTEGAGVLNWMLQGCASYLQSGLQMPAQVEAATQAYRDDQDIMGDWMRENCDVGPGKRCPKADVYRAYSAWASSSGYGRLSQGRFTRQLSGVSIRLSPDRRYYMGIELNAAGKDAARRGPC